MKHLSPQATTHAGRRRPWWTKRRRTGPAHAAAPALDPVDVADQFAADMDRQAILRARIEGAA